MGSALIAAGERGLRTTPVSPHREGVGRARLGPTGVSEWGRGPCPAHGERGRALPSDVRRSGGPHPRLTITKGEKRGNNSIGERGEDTLPRCREERRSGPSAPPPRGEAERSLCPTTARRGGTVSPSHCCEERRNGLSVPPLRGGAERPLCPTAARRGGTASLLHRREERRSGLSVPPLRGEEGKSALPPIDTGKRGRAVPPHPIDAREREAVCAGRKGAKGRPPSPQREAGRAATPPHRCRWKELDGRWPPGADGTAKTVRGGTSTTGYRGGGEKGINALRPLPG